MEELHVFWVIRYPTPPAGIRQLSSVNVLSCNEALAKNWEKYSLRFHCLIGPAIFCVRGIFFFMEEGLTSRSHQHVGPIHDIRRSTRECQDLIQ